MARCYPAAGPPRRPLAARDPESSPGLACPLLASSRSCQITSAACWRRPFISLRAARPGGRRPQARIMGRAKRQVIWRIAAHAAMGQAPAGMLRGIAAPPPAIARDRPQPCSLQGLIIPPEKGGPDPSADRKGSLLPLRRPPTPAAPSVPPPRRAPIAPCTGRRL
jgi:hypothetical protein